MTEDLAGHTTEKALHEPIDVDVTFLNPKIHNTKSPASGKPIPTSLPCIPKAFRTKTGRTVTISEIGLIHPKYNGIRTLFVFDVTDGAADYRLSLNTENLQWYLEWEGEEYL